MTMPLRVCAVVPTHDHWHALPGIVATLRSAQLPVFIIDDGSGNPACREVAALHQPDDCVEVHRLTHNQGKGCAVITGMRMAWERGYTHAVQVDADGQHDLAALPALLERSRAHPDALVSAEPIFDASMPLGRRIGRWVTHVWVWIEILSLRITDSMCGFRVYPLAAVRALVAEERVGQRMDFDTDVVVRLFWRGTPVEMVPARVIYPLGNTSNFRLLADNWRISVMHARLVAVMLSRLLLGPPRSRHWSGLGERGAWWGLSVSAFVCRLLGRRSCLIILAPVVAYFLATGAEQRRASREFLCRATGQRPTIWQIYRHFMSFAGRAVDSFRAWAGDIPADAVTTDTPEAFARLAADPHGKLLVVSHLGNADLSRVLLDARTQARLCILVHTRHAVNYNRLLRRFRPEAALNLVQVTEIGPETAIDLQQRIERGDWVVIAGDRTPVTGDDHVSFVPFLGQPAAFSHGPWILASLLRCPVHLLFCLRVGTRWRLTLEPFADCVVLDRKGRRDALRRYATDYAARLERMARAFPMQWYNFFGFWAH